MKHAVLLASLCASSATGCYFSRGLTVKPSGYELTPEMRAYADQMSVSKGTFDVEPIPYVAAGRATNRYEFEFDWLLLFLSGEWYGKLEDGYALESADLLIPLWLASTRQRYDATGVRTASYKGGLVGLYLPALALAGIGYEASRDEVQRTSNWDAFFRVLTLPKLQTSLFAVGTSQFDFLFIPFWRRDRSPPGPSGAETKA